MDGWLLRPAGVRGRGGVRVHEARRSSLQDWDTKGGEEKTSYFYTDRVHHASCLAQRTRVELLFYIGMKYSKQPLRLENRSLMAMTA